MQALQREIVMENKPVAGAVVGVLAYTTMFGRSGMVRAGAGVAFVWLVHNLVKFPR